MNICICVVYIIIISIIFKNIKVELFNNYGILFLNKNEACAVLIDEKTEKYISNFTLQEMKTRKCISNDYEYRDSEELINSCKRDYCDNVLNFKDNDKKRIQKIVYKIVTKIKKVYPKIPIITFKFIKTTNKVETGLPHTREDCIVLPENIIKYSDTDLMETILHEYIHILQKKYPESFKYLYTQIWPFVNVNKIEIPVNNKQRSNPDALKLTWAYKYDQKLFLPKSELSEKYGYRLNMPNKVAIPLKQINNSKYEAQTDETIQLDDLDGYNEKFCNITQNYHPNEISAVLITKIILDSTDNDKKCYRYLKLWLDSENWKK